jgi:hypothetical protein
MNRRYALMLATAIAACCGYAGAGDLNDLDVKDSYVQQGYAIAPVPLDLRGKSPAFVGLGSYIVNTAGCNDCHTWGPTGSNWAPGGNPFIGQPAVINTAFYLSGGRRFGPGVVSKNLTPDADGLPAGLTADEFIATLRFGRDVDDGHILQTMPWALIGRHTDRDLRALYEYLRAIPSLPNNY